MYFLKICYCLLYHSFCERCKHSPKIGCNDCLYGWSVTKWQKIFKQPQGHKDLKIRSKKFTSKVYLVAFD